MCSFLGVFLTSIFFATTLSTNGSVTQYGGFHALFKRIIANKILFNDEDNYIQQSNTLHDRNFWNDLIEVERSLDRIQYLKKNSDKEFRFEKPSYNVTTTTEFIGLLSALNVVTTLKNTVQYGLLTDDAYVNQVFRIGPTTGLLYSDTKLKKGVYNFEVTADIIDLQLHATANVTVNVTLPILERPLTIEPYIRIVLPDKKTLFSYLNGISEKVTPLQSSKRFQSALQPHKGTVVVNSPDIPLEISKNVYKEDVHTSYSDLWRKLIRQRTNEEALNAGLLMFCSQCSILGGCSHTRSETAVTQEFHPQGKISNERPPTKIIVPHEHFRYQRAIPPRVYATAVHEISPATTQIDNATVASIKIHIESPLVNGVMSSFILFVTTFASVILFGSLSYFIYKRLKKCGDYSVDDDIKYIERSQEDDMISRMKSDLKNPNFLCVNEIHQKRVTDSIVITKAKLQSHQSPSVFTIQKCYEAHQNQSSANGDNDDVFIVDMTQMSTNSQDDVYNTITLHSNTHSTPAITATLIGAPPPVSILSSSRRSSIVSIKKDGQSIGSEEIGPNGEMRRKSVTFSDIVELYQIKPN